MSVQEMWPERIMARLLLQHGTLKSLFEDRILFAPVSLDRGDKVLEIGTGPGGLLLPI
jgi:protein-L-isoaspartate O-methyltransferase